MKLKMILRICISCLVIAVAVAALWSFSAQAASTALVITQGNPIIQTFYTADPAPMVYNGTLYLYADHDEDVTVNNFFTMKDWRVYSTTDMVNWTDYGPQLSISSFSWAASDAWAGQVVPRNGKFYYYVPVTKKTGGYAIGVGVSNSPTGPFTDARGTPLIASSQIDPTVFIDDDGQAYLYWGNPNLYYVKLNQDMISYSGSIVQVSLTGFGSFTEAPWLSKRNGLYYMTYAAGGIPEHISYSTGPSATGPWTFRGIIMPQQGTSFTNHQGLIDYNGNSYFFYHNGALPGGGGYKRSIAVEKFTYNADGTIPTINMTTAGVPQIGTLNPYVTTQAETINWESGVKTEACSEGGMDVSNIENGDFIKVKGVNFSSGTASFDARVASATSGGNIEIRLDDSTGGTLLGTCAIAGTGGWQTWVTKTCTVSNATGIHDLYLRFTGGSGSLFNFNWWKFNTGSTGPTNTPVPPTNTPIPPTTGPTATPGTGPISINVGGSATGSFTADQYYSGGTAYTNTNTIDTSQVGSVPAAVFQSERYGAFSYTIPRVAGSAQTVTLYFAETYLTAAGQRLFNVSINGATVLSSFDIYASAGGQNKAIARTFNTTANSSGQVVIQFTTGTENPKVNGITVASGTGPTNTPVPPTNTPGPTNTTGPTPTKTNTPVPPTAGPTATPGGSFPVPGTYYRLINRNSGKVAEVAANSTADGGNVQQWTSTGTASQQWSFVSVGGGYYNIINRNSGKCLDVNGASTADGANVQQWTCGSGTNQRWQLIVVGSYYQLKAQHSGKVLDVVGNGTANGVNIDQWTWNSGNNQQWQIIP